MSGPFNPNDPVVDSLGFRGRIVAKLPDHNGQPVYEVDLRGVDTTATRFEHELKLAEIDDLCASHRKIPVMGHRCEACARLRAAKVDG